MHTGHELILLSGRDLQALLKPDAVIERCGKPIAISPRTGRTAASRSRSRSTAAARM